MKKYFIITATLLIFMITSLSASFVIEKRATKIAENWYQEISKKSTDEYNISDVLKKEYNDNLSYYIFKYEPCGFVIVSANDATTPILGYSAVSELRNDISNPALDEWLLGYAKQIDYAIRNGLDNKKTIQEWLDIEERNFSDFKLQREVTPLLTSTWSQGVYYNELCPYDTTSVYSNDHVPTGCVATAMAQVMKYWNHPAQGTGSHSYNHPDYGIQSADFGATTYDWSSMPNSLASGNIAVQTLMYHCGVSVDMNYGPNGSGASSSEAAGALRTYFGYTPSLDFAEKADYTDSGWKQLLKDELEAERPVYYRGTGPAGGHAFVCDGYEGTDHFHFNWGWSGYANGFFYLDDLNPGGYNFTNDQSAIVGAMPNEPALTTPRNFSVTEWGYANWDKAGYKDELIHHSGYNGNGIGTGNVSQFICLARFDSNQLSQYYDEYSISEIYITVRSLDYDFLEIQVYEGGTLYNPGPVVYSSDVTSETVIPGDKFTHILSSPVPLVSSNDYYIGYEIHNTGDHPAATDSGPMVQNYGAWVYYNGSWSQLTGLNSSLDYNWVISGLVTPGVSKKLVTEARERQKLDLHAEMPHLISNGKLELSSNENMNVTNNQSNYSKNLLGYNLYLDDVYVDYTTVLNWQFTDLSLGESYTAGVTAVFDEGESDIVEDSFTFQLYPPVNFTITTSGNDVQLSWDAASGATSYKVYRSESPDGSFSLLDTTSNTAYTDLDAGLQDKYFYYVTAVLSAK